MKKKAKAAKKKKVTKKIVKKVKKVAKKTVKKSAHKTPKKKTPAKKAKAAVKPGIQPAPGETNLGLVEDYFSHISVIALKLQNSLSIGNTIHVRGHTTDITEKIESMQINHDSVSTAKKGDSVGIKIGGKCRKGDHVFRVN